MKKITALALVLVAIASIALAAGASLSIRSTQALDKQFQAFRGYLDSLSPSDRAAWMAELTSIASEGGSGSVFSGLGLAQTHESSANTQVRLPKSGSKFHSFPECSNMKNPRPATREEALRQGYEPCKKCKP